MWLDLGDYRGPSHFHAFVMYALARRRRKQSEWMYRTYVTESLRNIPQGQYIPHELSHYLKPREEIDVEDIISRVASAVSED